MPLHWNPTISWTTRGRGGVHRVHPFSPTLYDDCTRGGEVVRLIVGFQWRGIFFAWYHYFCSLGHKRGEAFLAEGFLYGYQCFFKRVKTMKLLCGPTNNRCTILFFSMKKWQNLKTVYLYIVETVNILRHYHDKAAYQILLRHDK